MFFLKTVSEKKYCILLFFGVFFFFGGVGVVCGK